MPTGFAVVRVRIRVRLGIPEQWQGHSPGNGDTRIGEEKAQGIFATAKSMAPREPHTKVANALARKPIFYLEKKYELLQHDIENQKCKPHRQPSSLLKSKRLRPAHFWHPEPEGEVLTEFPSVVGLRPGNDDYLVSQR